ncbi:MAG: hypothetical protein ABIW47_01210, partial [Ginsengibacter sp.]
SNPRKTFEKAFNIGKICSSLKTYDEFRDVLLRSKFDKYISVEKKCCLKAIQRTCYIHRNIKNY